MYGLKEVEQSETKTSLRHALQCEKEYAAICSGLLGMPLLPGPEDGTNDFAEFSASWGLLQWGKVETELFHHTIKSHRLTANFKMGMKLRIPWELLSWVDQNVN